MCPRRSCCPFQLVSTRSLRPTLKQIELQFTCHADLSVICEPNLALLLLFLCRAIGASLERGPGADGVGGPGSERPAHAAFRSLCSCSGLLTDAPCRSHDGPWLGLSHLMTWQVPQNPAVDGQLYVGLITSGPSIVSLSGPHQELLSGRHHSPLLQMAWPCSRTPEACVAFSRWGLPEALRCILFPTANTPNTMGSGGEYGPRSRTGLLYLLHSAFLRWAPSEAGSLPSFLAWTGAELLGVACVASRTQRGLPGTLFPPLWYGM